MSDQLETAVLLATPVFLLVLAFAPLMLQLAYSSEFREAAGLLRLQILGDVFKVMAWPLAMRLLAERQSWTYWSVETLTAIAFTAFVGLTVNKLGLQSAGLGYLAMYLFYIAAQVAVSARYLHLSRHALIASGLCTASVAAILGVAFVSETATMIIGTAAALIFGYIAFRRMQAASAFGFGKKSEA